MRRFLIVFNILVVFCSALAFTDNSASSAGQTEVEYFAVFLMDQKIGHAIHIRQVNKGVVTTSQQMNLTISRGAFSMNVTASETSIETTEGKPIAFESIENLGYMSKTVVGKFTDEGKLEVTTSQMGAATETNIDFPSDALLAEGLRLLETKKGLAEGAAYEAKIFSLALLVPVKAKIKVGKNANVDLLGRVVPLTEVEVTLSQLDVPEGTAPWSIVSTSFVDKEFKAIKTVTQMLGMTLELVACDKEFAQSQNSVIDFLDSLLLQSPVELKNIPSIRSAAYQLCPIEGAELVIPDTDSQTVKKGSNGQVIVTVEPSPPQGGITFPYKGSNKEALEALKSTGYLQSDNKEIIDLAKMAAGDTKDAAIAAKRIEQFVRGYIIEKDLSVGYASAAEVLQSRQGDCTEHAVLTAAMCRALGIPARLALGLVYADNFVRHSNVFGGHAWTEVYIGNKWTGIDATKAPDGFGVGHLTLATGNGDPGDFFSMISTLGYFQIEQISTKE